MVQKNDMAGLLAAYGIALFEHTLEDIAVADLRYLAVYIIIGAELVEAHVAHDCDNGRVAVELAALLHILCANGDYLIAVNNFAVFVNRKKSVCVAVEGEARHKTVLNDIFSKIFKVSRAAVVIDIDAVRLV